MQQKDGFCFVPILLVCVFYWAIETIDTERYQWIVFVDAYYFIIVAVSGSAVGFLFVCLFSLSSFDFAYLELFVPCIFLDVVNLFRLAFSF